MNWENKLEAIFTSPIVCAGCGIAVNPLVQHSCKQKPLSDDEILKLIPKDNPAWEVEICESEIIEFVRNIEKAHGIGE